MQINTSNELLELKDNKFIGKIPKFTNSQINFKGKNNILVCEDGVHLSNCRIDFNFDNSVLYLSTNSHEYSVNIEFHNNNVCFIGKNNFFNGKVTFVLLESRNIILGDDCLISNNVVFRTADGYPIYHASTKNRLNHAKSIYVGDHVRFGQNTMVFKGSKIGSGSIIGAKSVVSNKTIASNTALEGAPLRIIEDDILWIPNSFNNSADNEMPKFDSELLVYKVDETTLDFEDVEHDLNKFSNPESVVSYIESNFLGAGKNRFSIETISENRGGKLIRFFKYLSNLVDIG